ncbi:Y-box-binding protein 3-like [Rousettus aegyptiacus]|uniref:CSD domain-containing protein n=1 Tax=Rousettus aegyptiacus TaxID=9407 RepID=A0A7J8EKU9_ROUAE|nr:Y-box-binding protein 3-like [Rousettus aegyptiacus]KAF6435779.1 hypothetical protein HJG63_012507 [Rousettus aegyptiacus]
MGEAGEATLRKGAASVSPQDARRGLLSLGGGDSSRALVVSNLSRDAISEATAAAGARGKAPKKVIAKGVRGSVKWFNVKKGYGFIRRHDREEDVFVHHTAIARNNPHKYQRSVGDGETVEFDVVLGERGTEAANVTGPAGAPVEGSRFAANRSGVRRGFYICRRTPQPRRHQGAEDDVDEGEGGGDGFTVTRGPRRRLPSLSPDQRRRCSPFRRAQAVPGLPSILAPDRGLQAAHLPGPAPAARPQGAPPARRPGLSYRLSRPRGRGRAPGPKPSSGISEELTSKDKESGRVAGGLQQRPPPCCGSRLPIPEGAEGKIRQGPAEARVAPARVAKKSSPAVVDAPATAQAE